MRVLFRVRVHVGLLLVFFSLVILPVLDIVIVSTAVLPGFHRNMLF